MESLEGRRVLAGLKSKNVILNSFIVGEFALAA
jgi:hypothetical protein